MTQKTGIALEREGTVWADTAAAVNDCLSAEGIRVWPLDLSGSPHEVRSLLDQPTLSDAKLVRARDQFLLPRERLLRVIDAAGRRPNHPEGGALHTSCIETEIAYPQLHVISRELDYSGFSPLHVNVGEDGSGSDEVGQSSAGAVWCIATV